MAEQSAVNSPPLCSVIVPVYNGEKCIARCLAALARQTISPAQLEVIIVDDGSTDGTAACVMDWVDGHPGAATLVKQHNSGPASARNHGARLAQGCYLLFTDADCIPNADWAQTFVERFQQPDQPAAIMGSYISAQRAPAAQFAQLEFEERYALLRSHPTIDLVATYSAAYRRDIFLAAGGFDPALIMNEDVDLAYRLSDQGRRLVFAPVATVEHRHHEDWRAYFRVKFGRGYWRALVYRRFPQKAVRDSYTPQLLKLQAPLAFLVLGAPLLSLTFRSARWLWLAFPFLLTVAPTMLSARRKGSPALHWVVWGVWLRSLALTLGAVVGLIASATRRPATKTAAVSLRGR